MKLLRLPSLGDIVDDALVALRRFPLPACAALGVTVAAIASAEKIELFEGLFGTGTLFTFCVLGFFATLLAKLVAERSGGREPYFGGVRGLAIAIVLLALAAWVVASGPTGGRAFDPNVSALFLLAGLFFSLMAVPYARDAAGNAAFWAFNRSALTGAAFGLAVAVILGLGLSAILLALDKLFGLAAPRDLWSDFWIFSFCLIWPWRALASMPVGFEKPEEDYCPAWIGFLARYVFVPLAAVYLVILYAFAIKILVLWDLPRGQVAWLVCFFALIGVATKLIVYPLRESGHKLLRLFDRILFPALFLPAALLAVAVGVRILDYGVTEERYLLVLLTVWLFMLAAYFSFGGKRLVLAPLSLGVLLTVVSVGPWGAIDYSVRDQIARLEPLLHANNLLVDGQLTPAAEPVPFAADKQISSVLHYLSAPHRRRAFNGWLDGRDSALGLKPEWRTRQFAQALGLKFVRSWQKRPRFSIALSTREPLVISGFDLMAEQRHIIHRTKWNISDPGSSKRYLVTMHSETNSLIVTEGNGLRLTFDLAAIVRQASKQMATNSGRIDDRAAMTRDASRDGFRVRLIVRSIFGTQDGDKIKVESLNAIVLIASH